MNERLPETATPEIQTLLSALQHEIDAGTLNYQQASLLCQEYAGAYGADVVDRVISQLQTRNYLNALMLDAFTERRVKIHE